MFISPYREFIFFFLALAWNHAESYWLPYAQTDKNLYFYFIIFIIFTFLPGKHVLRRRERSHRAKRVFFFNYLHDL